VVAVGSEIRTNGLVASRLPCLKISKTGENKQERRAHMPIAY
jgi:hypothetical protein